MVLSFSPSAPEPEVFPPALFSYFATDARERGIDYVPDGMINLFAVQYSHDGVVRSFFGTLQGCIQAHKMRQTRHEPFFGSCRPDALQYIGLITYEGLGYPVTEASPIHVRLDAGKNALEYPICYLLLETLHQGQDSASDETIPEEPVHYSGSPGDQDEPDPYSFNDEPVVDERQSWNDGDEVEEAGTQIRRPVPVESAAGKELNSENGAEPDIKQYQRTGHRSLGA